MIGFVINTGFCALNVGLYANHPNPWSLGAAVFCGFVAVFCLALDLS